MRKIVLFLGSILMAQILILFGFAINYIKADNALWFTYAISGILLLIVLILGVRRNINGND